MPTASYVKYTAAIEPLLEGINAGTDTWNIALAATVNAADTTFTNIKNQQEKKKAELLLLKDQLTYQTLLNYLTQKLRKK